MATDCIGPAAAAAVERLKDGEVTLLENVRFHKEETKNVPEFAKVRNHWPAEVLY
jgi:3-phosphoglycerate kinase